MQDLMRFIAVPLLTVSLVTASYAQESNPKQVLKDYELRLVGDTAILQSESQVTKQLAEIPKFKKRLMDASKERARAEQMVTQKDVMLRQLVQQRLTLNAQLANVSSVEQNNRLVGAINALGDQINLMADSEKLEEAAKESRKNANAVREAYVDHVMELRKLYEQVATRYEELKTDATLQETLTALSDDKPVKLGPSRTFSQANEKIRKVEDTVLSETITLRQEGGVWFASVVVNDAAPEEFVVDTGAGLLSIPMSLAEDMKIVPTSSSPTIRLGLADGRVIEAKQVFAEKVRVGKFTVENVECAILPENAVNADPLLGQSFLGKFTFQLDGDKGELTMTKVEGEDTATGGKARSRRK